MNLATVIVLLVVLALVVLAIIVLRRGRSGSCCDGKSTPKDNGCAGCSVDCPFRR